MHTHCSLTGSTEGLVGGQGEGEDCRGRDSSAPGKLPRSAHSECGLWTRAETGMGCCQPAVRESAAGKLSKYVQV